MVVLERTPAARLVDCSLTRPMRSGQLGQLPVFEGCNMLGESVTQTGQKFFIFVLVTTLSFPTARSKKGNDIDEQLLSFSPKIKHLRPDLSLVAPIYR